MSYKWRIICTEPGDEGYQFAWSDTAITECPNDSGHSVDVNSVTRIKEEKADIRIYPHTTKVKGSNYTEVATCYFNPDYYSGDLRRVKLLSYLDNGATSYDVEIFDRDNNVQLVESNFINKSEEVQRQVTGVISSPPYSNTVLEINVKKTGGNNKKCVHISEIIFYFG
jgi:hypothetical protein